MAISLGIWKPNIFRQNHLFIDNHKNDLFIGIIMIYLFIMITLW